MTLLRWLFRRRNRTIRPIVSPGSRLAAGVGRVRSWWPW